MASDTPQLRDRVSLRALFNLTITLNFWQQVDRPHVFYIAVSVVESEHTMLCVLQTERV